MLRRAEDPSPYEPSFAKARYLLPVVVPVSICPGIWILSTFLFRGGVAMRLAGLTLVRPSGRKALRIQCAWRTSLVWLPVVGLLVLVGWIDFQSPDLAWLATVVQGLTLALLLVFAALAFRFPSRGIHDWLAGTYLVPR